MYLDAKEHVPQCFLDSAAVSPPQDDPRHPQKYTEPLQVEYYPPNGTFSLHYFPYYGKKAQVSLAPVRLLSYLATGKPFSMALLKKKKTKAEQRGSHS